MKIQWKTLWKRKLKAYNVLYIYCVGFRKLAVIMQGVFAMHKMFTERF